jgi:hypothetical protein
VAGAAAALRDRVASAQENAADRSRPSTSDVSQNDVSENDVGGSDLGDEGEHPVGWCYYSSTHQERAAPPPEHEIRSDVAAAWQGSAGVWMGTHDPALGARFSTDAVWQGIDATPFGGARLEIAVRVRNRGHIGYFFVRGQRRGDPALVLIDAQSPTTPRSNLFFGTFVNNSRDWLRLAIIYEVPADVEVIYYGVALLNGGNVDVDGWEISEVAGDVPLTSAGTPGGRAMLVVDPRAVLDAPTNLGYEVRGPGRYRGNGTAGACW